MVMITSIVVVLLLVGFFLLIKLTPHKGAGSTEKSQPRASGNLHPGESRTSDLN
jgi:hypothetical protein